MKSNIKLTNTDLDDLILLELRQLLMENPLANQLFRKLVGAGASGVSKSRADSLFKAVVGRAAARGARRTKKGDVKPIKAKTITAALQTAAGQNAAKEGVKDILAAAIKQGLPVSGKSIARQVKARMPNATAAEQNAVTAFLKEYQRTALAKGKGNQLSRAVAAARREAGPTTTTTTPKTTTPKTPKKKKASPVNGKEFARPTGGRSPSALSKQISNNPALKALTREGDVVVGYNPANNMVIVRTADGSFRGLFLGVKKPIKGVVPEFSGAPVRLPVNNQGQLLRAPGGRALPKGHLGLGKNTPATNLKLGKGQGSPIKGAKGPAKGASKPQPTTPKPIGSKGLVGDITATNIAKQLKLGALMTVLSATNKKTVFAALAGLGVGYYLFFGTDAEEEAKKKMEALSSELASLDPSLAGQSPMAILQSTSPEAAAELQTAIENGDADTVKNILSDLSVQLKQQVQAATDPKQIQALETIQSAVITIMTDQQAMLQNAGASAPAGDSATPSSPAPGGVDLDGDGLPDALPEPAPAQGQTGSLPSGTGITPGADADGDGIPDNVMPPAPAAATGSQDPVSQATASAAAADAAPQQGTSSGGSATTTADVNAISAREKANFAAFARQSTGIQNSREAIRAIQRALVRAGFSVNRKGAKFSWGLNAASPGYRDEKMYESLLVKFGIKKLINEKRKRVLQRPEGEFTRQQNIDFQIDGKYGPKTKEAVIAFQKAVNSKFGGEGKFPIGQTGRGKDGVDAVVGPKTWNFLSKYSKRQRVQGAATQGTAAQGTAAQGQGTAAQDAEGADALKTPIKNQKRQKYFDYADEPGRRKKKARKGTFASVEDPEADRRVDPKGYDAAQKTAKAKSSMRDLSLQFVRKANRTLEFLRRNGDGLAGDLQLIFDSEEGQDGVTLQNNPFFWVAFIFNDTEKLKTILGDKFDLVPKLEDKNTRAYKAFKIIAQSEKYRRFLRYAKKVDAEDTRINAPAAIAKRLRDKPSDFVRTRQKLRQADGRPTPGPKRKIKAARMFKLLRQILDAQKGGSTNAAMQMYSKIQSRYGGADGVTDAREQFQLLDAAQAGFKFKRGYQGKTKAQALRKVEKYVRGKLGIPEDQKLSVPEPQLRLPKQGQASLGGRRARRRSGPLGDAAQLDAPEGLPPGLLPDRG